MSVPLVGVAVVGLGLTPPAADAATPSCQGKRATIYSTAKNATVRGTNGADVIVATGKGAKVYGLGGNDRICTKQSSLADGGAGDDKVQVAGGTARGGSGTDVLTADPKATGTVTLDGGSGTDSYIATKIAKVTVRGTAGELVNGYPVDVTAPQSGAPAFSLVYGFENSPSVYTGVQNPDGVQDAIGPNDTVAAAAHLFQPRAAIGHRIVSWSVDFGDGTAPRTGFGPPPDQVPHLYLQPGLHTVTARVVDDAGRAGVRQVNVTAGGAPTVQLSSSAPVAGLSTLHLAVAPGVATAISSWALTFDDGSVPVTGTGQPPTDVPHQFPVGRFTPRLVVVSTTGTSRADTTTVNAGDGAQHVVAFTTTPQAVPGARPTFTAGGFSFPTVATPATTVGAGDTVTLDLGGSSLIDSYDVDWGDNVTVHTSANSVTHTYFSAGSRNVTVVAHPTNPGPDVVTNIPLTITATQLVAQLSAAQHPTEGKVNLSTKGSKATGTSAWIIDFGDGSAPKTGTGLPPATVAHTYSSCVCIPTLRLDSGVSAADSAAQVLTVVSTRSRITNTVVTTSEGSGTFWAPALTSPSATSEPNAGFGLTSLFTAKRRANLATVDFGDGRAANPAPGFADGTLSTNDVREPYATAGEYDVHSVIKDDKGQRDSAWTHVSVAGRSQFNAINAVAAQNVAVSVFPALALGANEQVDYWSVTWGDGTQPTQAYGAMPTTLTHAFAQTGNRTVTFSARLVHGGTITKTITYAVS